VEEGKPERLSDASSGLSERDPWRFYKRGGEDEASKKNSQPSVASHPNWGRNKIGRRKTFFEEAYIGKTKTRKTG